MCRPGNLHASRGASTLRAGRVGDRTEIRLTLRGVAWVEVPRVRCGRPQETALAARIVAAASHGALLGRGGVCSVSSVSYGMRM